MELIKTAGVALIAGIVAVGGFAFLAPQAVAPSFGAISGPEISSPYLSWGGVNHWAGRAALKQATTTVCAIQSPTSTSTLVAAGMNWTVGTTTASSVTIAKSATPFATTTTLTKEAVAANAQVSIMVPASYSAISTSTLVFAPNQYVVVGVEGGIGTFSPTGSCYAEFRQMAY